MNMVVHEPTIKKPTNPLLEIPMTIRHMNMFTLEGPYSLKKIARELKRFVVGRNQWLRLDPSLSEKPMLKLIESVYQNNQYLMFMIHSSELMPGGSPNFKSHESIESLYVVVENVFRKIASLGYKGMTLAEYVK